MKWGGFNVPIDTEEEEITGGIERPVYKKQVERGWSGKTWPGRTVGPPYTADGGFVVSSYPLQKAMQTIHVSFYFADCMYFS